MSAIDTSSHQDRPGGGIPHIYERAGESFASFLETHRSAVEKQLRAAGAVLFRGFDLAQRAAFDGVLDELCREVIADYGDLPPESGTSRVYASTPYRPDRAIPFHNESSHLPSWPTRQFFACVIAAEQGGETPIVDCRRIYQRLPPPIRAKFANYGLRYLRHFIEGIDVSWQSFFKTSDRAEVDRLCRERGSFNEWKPDGTLKVVQQSQAIARNPVTDEMTFFNQIMLHHPFYLPAEDRAALESAFGRNSLPRSVVYGDGSAIEERVLRLLHELYQSEAQTFSWQAGDLLMLDNMSVAHGRAPFAGRRKIIVGLGDPMSRHR